MQDPRPERLTDLVEKFHISTFTDVERALGQRAEAVLVCSPTAYHLPQAMDAVQRGMHVFIEKPMSHSLEGIDDLINAAEGAGLVVLVACNLRFLPSLQLVKQFLDEGKVGKPLASRAYGGFYLPYWRPNTDYRLGYGARSDLGGGVILDFIHELDYLRWFFGHPSEVFCWTGKFSSLEIDTEDIASMLLRFPESLVAQLQLDYLQPTYRRGMEIIGEEGTIVWDFASQSVKLYGRDNNRYQVFLENINTELNSMYVLEMEHFVRCIQRTENPMVNAREGRAAVELAEAAKLSSQEGRVVCLPLGSTG